MNSVQNSSDRRRSSVTMKTNHSRNNSATMSNNSSSSSLGSRNSTTTTSNNVDQQQHQHFLFHAPDPHLHAPLDPLHHRSLIDFRGGSGSLLTFDHPSTAWENFNGGWDGPMGNNNGANPPDLSTTQEFNAVYHPTAKDDTPKRPNLGESLQPQKKQCNSSGSAATNSKPTTNKIAAKSVLESKDPQSIAAKNRRERISERLKTLQELVPNGSKVDLVTMLEKAISYVKFLQLQVKVLATDEFWPAQGARAPDISQVKEAIDAILSTQRARKSSSSNSNSR